MLFRQTLVLFIKAVVVSSVLFHQPQVLFLQTATPYPSAGNVLWVARAPASGQTTQGEKLSINAGSVIILNWSLILAGRGGDKRSISVGGGGGRGGLWGDYLNIAGEEVGRL